MTLDRYDRHILDLLQQDSRISNQDLADKIGLTPSPCLRRVKTLEDAGFITAYRALVDARKLGLTLMALIHISMDQHTPERFQHFEASIVDIPEVLRVFIDYRTIGRLSVESGGKRHGCLSRIIAQSTDPYYGRNGCA